MSLPAINGRSFLRIRLVGLLLIVTCVCCLLAAWQQSVLRPYRQRQDLLRVLAQWDAHVNYSTPDDDWLQRILGKEYGQIRDRIVNINVMGPRFGDNDVKGFLDCVAELPYLESINLLETSVSGSGLRDMRSKLPGVRVKHATGFLRQPSAIR